MEELLSGERREGLKAAFCETVDREVLTNADAIIIIDILKAACERKKITLYENVMKDMIEGTDGE